MADRLLGISCTEIMQAYYNTETHTRVGINTFSIYIITIIQPLIPILYVIYTHTLCVSNLCILLNLMIYVCIFMYVLMYV